MIDQKVIDICHVIDAALIVGVSRESIINFVSREMYSAMKNNGVPAEAFCAPKSLMNIVKSIISGVEEESEKQPGTLAKISKTVKRCK